MSTRDNAKEMVQHVAKLARLSLGDDEAERLGRDMANILSVVDQLSELDFSNAQAAELSEGALPTVFREDVVKERVPLDVLLQNAPHREGDFFRVPKIMDN